MIFTDKEYCLEVWGDIACFTRPEFKVERVSYDVITPSAARAIFQAIFWKPAISWEITAIEVLNPIKWQEIRRNEVGAVASPRSKGCIYIEEKRQQRNTLFLKDVRYRLYARMKYIPVAQRNLADMKHEPDGSENPMKYYEMFERRASKGQCFTQPYLGTRECSAAFRLVKPGEALEAPIAESRDLGFMLFDRDYSNNKNAMLFHAYMLNGKIDVPSVDSPEILR